VISTQVRDGIPVVELNRPERHNALLPELAQRLAENLEAARAYGRPVILTGAGPSFCVGADLKWLGALPDPAHGVAELVAMHHLAITTLLEMPVPVIAAINGPAAGGGVGIALAADYRVAAGSATVTMGYFRIGLTPDGGSSALLQQLIGRARTLELLLTNRSLSADEARTWGLINEVVPGDQLLSRALAFAQSLEPVPGYALSETRSLLDTVNLKNHLQLESVAIRTAARGQRFREALQAFLTAHQ
jgi:2-(1,2-epoxy-1,2-dihydrophenyl)acetyl-CoA isomerase